LALQPQLITFTLERGVPELPPHSLAVLKADIPLTPRSVTSGIPILVTLAAVRVVEYFEEEPAE